MWLHLFCWQRATSPCISADHTDRKALLKTPESMKSLTNFRSAPSSPIFFRSPKHDTQNLIHNIEPYTSTKPIPMPYTLLTITSTGQCLVVQEYQPWPVLIVYMGVKQYLLHQTRREQPHQPPAVLGLSCLPRAGRETILRDERGSACALAGSRPFTALGPLAELTVWDKSEL